LSLSLNHFSIRSTDLAACQRFYCDALGLVNGPRPPFPFPGLWLYAGDTGVWANAVVHIIGIDHDDPEGLKKYLGDRDLSSLQGSGRSITWPSCHRPDETITRLDAQRVAWRERTVPLLGLHQLFVDDPNGVVVELNFPATEAAGR
jgi:catechol 2,3-dioxygenase-like lactoylglutathione lyase family enzyme